MPKAPKPAAKVLPSSLGKDVTVQQAADHVATADEDTKIEPITGVQQVEHEAGEAAEATTDQTGAPWPPKSGDMDELGFLPLTEAGTYINALWYGREGTGKTTDLASMANAGPMLLINAEAGIKIAPLRRLGIKVDNIQLWPKPGVQITFDRLEALFWKMQDDLANDPKSWAGVGFDSLTEIHQILLDNIVDEAVKKATKKHQERDRFFIDRSDYGAMSKQVRLLIRRFRDLPCHFGITALERRDTDEDTGKVIYGPALTPALQTDVLGYVDLVLYCKAEALMDQTEYRALTRPRGKYRAKDRFGITPPVLVNPSFERVEAYVAGTLEPDTDQTALASQEAHRQANELAAADAAKKEADKPANRRTTTKVNATQPKEPTNAQAE